MELPAGRPLQQDRTASGRLLPLRVLLPLQWHCSKGILGCKCQAN